MRFLFGGLGYLEYSKRKEEIIMWDLIAKILEFVSPELRKFLVDFILELDEKAKLTPNLWDDVLVFLLKKMFAIS